MVIKTFAKTLYFQNQLIKFPNIEFCILKPEDETNPPVIEMITVTVAQFWRTSVIFIRPRVAYTFYYIRWRSIAAGLQSKELSGMVSSLYVRYVKIKLGH
jgi:hypothetical protein